MLILLWCKNMHDHVRKTEIKKVDEAKNTMKEKHIALDQEHNEHEIEGKHKEHKNHHQMMLQDFKKRFIVSLIITMPILVLSPFLQQILNFKITFTGDLYVLFVLSSVVYIYGGYPFLKGMIAEIKGKKPGMMTLIGLAISVAYVYSGAVIFLISGRTFFWELATLIDIMLLGHWIEMRAVLGASRALEKITKLIPSTAHLILENETIVDVPTSKLKVGDVVLVRPGERIPADGVIIKGETSVDESMLTGESIPVSKKASDTVIGGSINLEGAIVARIEHAGEETYLSQIIKLIQEAQKTRSKMQDLADRAAFVLTVIAIIGGLTTFIIWLLFGFDVLFALERMVTVMVITCPHALGLAIPLVVAVSTSTSAQNGLLIRNRQAFERARNVQVVILDKTGTLTEGRFGVTDIIPLADFTEDEILAFAASLEVNSEHPIARGIMEKAKAKKIKLLNVDNFKAIPGRGVQGIIDGKKVMIASPGFLKEKGIKVNNSQVIQIQKQGKTTVFVMVDDTIIGAIALADIIRPESIEAIKELKSMGIRCVMLTGDNKVTAKSVAEQLGIDEFFAEVLPHEKVNVVKKLQEQGYIVAMVGDGVNDAPALIQADIGIAIGAGTDVAIESADIILVKNDPRNVVSVIKLAKITFNKMKENLMWATGYNVVAIPTAAGVLYNYGILLSPAIGAILMSLSTVIVAVNARLFPKL